MIVMLRFLFVLLGVALAGCGGSSSPGGSPAASQGSFSPTTGSTATAPNSARGLAVAVSVKKVANRLARGEEIQEVVLDVLDPVTLRSVLPPTIVRRDPAQTSQSVRLDVPAGNWLLRVQGRTVEGQAAGTRFESTVPVSTSQVTVVQAELNPLTDLSGLQVTPGPQVLLAPGTTRQLTATGIRSDLTSENVTNNVIWSTSAASVANVSATGLVTALGVGTATLTARTGNLTASTSVNVSQVNLTELQVTPSTLTLAVGLTRQLTGTGIFSDNTHQDLTSQVTWTSSDPDRVPVSASGLVTGQAPANATITARQGQLSASAAVSVQASLVRLEVTPATTDLPVGKAQQLKATGFFNDNTTQDLTASVTWSSSALGVATVSSTGLARAVAQGAANATATTGNVSASARLNVTAAELTSITVTPANTTVPKGAAVAFRATGTFSDQTTRDITETATWTTANASVVVVSNANGTRGQATGANVGLAVVEAAQDALTGSAGVNVTPATLVALDLRPENPVMTRQFDTLQFQVFGRYTDGTSVDLTTNATWTSSKPTVATISNAAGSQGLATALATGITAIQVASGNVTNATALRVDIPGPPGPMAPGRSDFVLVSQNPSGQAGNGASDDFSRPCVSQDGRYVAFRSFSSDLVPNDTNGVADIFRRDTLTNTTIRVSVDSTGAQANGASSFPAMTPDGRYIAYHSLASNLVAGDTNGSFDCFRYDTLTGATIRVSLFDFSNAEIVATSIRPRISNDGDRICFECTGVLNVADTNANLDIYVRTVTTTATTLASVRELGGASNGNSQDSKISGDGHFVVFDTDATDMFATPDTNGVNDVVRRDLVNVTTRLVSFTGGGATGNGASTRADVSGNGRFVVFQSLANNLGAVVDTNGVEDAYRVDLTTDTVALASVGPGGVQSNGASQLPNISADGRFVSFNSAGSNLAPDVNPGLVDVFVRDMTGLVTILADRTATGVQANAAASDCGVSADNRWLIFFTAATNLDANDTNLVNDVYEGRNTLVP